MKPTHKEIFELAREVELLLVDGFSVRGEVAHLERFAALLLERFGAGGGEPMFWYRPCSNGMYEGPIHDAQIESVRRESGAWKPLFPHPSPTDLRAEYERGLEDAKKVALDADHMGSVNLRLMKNRISNAIEVLKGKQ